MNILIWTYTYFKRENKKKVVLIEGREAKKNGEKITKNSFPFVYKKILFKLSFDGWEISLEKFRPKRNWRAKDKIASESCAEVILCVGKRKLERTLENLNLDFSSTASEEQFGKQEKPLCTRSEKKKLSPPGIFSFINLNFFVL